MTDTVLESVLPQVEQRRAQQVAERRLPGAAAGLVRGQDLVWSQGFGDADIVSRQRPEADPIDHVGSLVRVRGGR